MIQIERGPWNEMLAHARAVYPEECCGAMLGYSENGAKRVTAALPLENAFDGPRVRRYELRPEDLLACEREARRRGLKLVGVYHSHPDCDACFSQPDLRNSRPWHSFLVLSVRRGEFDHAHCWLPNAAQTRAIREEMLCG